MIGKNHFVARARAERKGGVTTDLQRDRRGETASYVLYIFRGKFDTLNSRLEYD